MWMMKAADPIGWRDQEVELGPDHRERVKRHHPVESSPKLSLSCEHRNHSLQCPIRYAWVHSFTTATFIRLWLRRSARRSREKVECSTTLPVPPRKCGLWSLRRVRVDMLAEALAVGVD